MIVEARQLPLDEVESGVHYKNCSFDYSEDLLRFSNVTFEKCTFQQTVFDHSEWLDCQFIQVNFSNFSLSNSVFYRCKFDKCQLTGTNFDHNHWKNNEVNECKGNYLNLSDSALEACRFLDTYLPEAYFQSAKIKKSCHFIRCELESADFLDTPLKGVDFSESLFTDLRVSPNQLKECVINPYQAAVFVRLLGVKIKD